MQPTYVEFVQGIKDRGRHIPSRYGDTVELLATSIHSPAGEMLDRSNTNYNVAYAELMGLVAGVYDPALIKMLAPNAQHVLFTHAMAYGPRTTLQVPRLLDKLMTDPLTRQALLFIGKPEDGATNDQPCTTTMQFLLRDGALHCIVSMRSNDVIKGTPTDLIMFHGLNMLMAHCLGVAAGPITLNAGSSHIYERDFDRLIRPTTRYFMVRPDLTRDFLTIRDIALEESRVPDFWPAASGRKHRVPPLFLEIMYPVPTE